VRTSHYERYFESTKHLSLPVTRDVSSFITGAACASIATLISIPVLGEKPLEWVAIVVISTGVFFTSGGLQVLWRRCQRGPSGRKL